MDYKKLIETKEYDFLRENEHLKDNIILLALGGSRAYGTNNEFSDVDIRGCALERPSDLIGFTKFDHVVETNTDTTVYSFNKIIGLLLKMNPNVVEILGCKEEHYIYLSDIGKQLLANKEMFLSQMCIESFAGYADQQLSRLKNSLARDRVSQSEKEYHIKKSMERAMKTFDKRYSNFNDNSIKLKVQKSMKNGLDSEIFISIDIKDFPIRDTVSILSEMQSIMKLYNKINHRNKKKDDNHLDRHAMHLVRLYLMVIDILEYSEIKTYREKDLVILKKIRGGYFRNIDGTYSESFFDVLREYEKKFEYASKHTTLPLLPDIDKVEEFVMEVNRGILK